MARTQPRTPESLGHFLHTGAIRRNKIPSHLLKGLRKRYWQRAKRTHCLVGDH